MWPSIFKVFSPFSKAWSLEIWVLVVEGGVGQLILFVDNNMKKNSEICEVIFLIANYFWSSIFNQLDQQQSCPSKIQLALIIIFGI